MAKNECCVWDFTLSKKEVNDFDELMIKIKKDCKAWCFQLEKGKEAGFEHYQGRISLKIKSRKGPSWYKMRWSPTSSENRDNDFYCCKDDTRIEGPWKDTDIEVYIPRHYRNIKLYDWQNKILETRNDFDDRTCNLLYCPNGNTGKSTVASLGELKYGAIDLPPVNDYKELIQVMYCICHDKNIRTPKLVFFDMPRALDKERLYGLYTALEQIKKGKLYDMRYHYKDWWIDSPTVWVFSNHLPDLSVLSKDRWKIWKFDTDKNDNDVLVRFLGGDTCNNNKKSIKRII